MVSHVLLIALLAAAQGGLAPARTTYTRCLGNMLRADLKERTKAEDFEAKLANACKGEEAAFRSASISTDLAAKISRPAAEQNAADEIGYIRENTVEKYKDYIESNTQPR
jgi:hypothetical protein